MNTLSSPKLTSFKARSFFSLIDLLLFKGRTWNIQRFRKAFSFSLEVKNSFAENCEKFTKFFKIGVIFNVIFLSQTSYYSLETQNDSTFEMHLVFPSFSLVFFCFFKVSKLRQLNDIVEHVQSSLKLVLF